MGVREAVVKQFLRSPDFFSHLRMPNGGEGDDYGNLFRGFDVQTDQNF